MKTQLKLPDSGAGQRLDIVLSDLTGKTRSSIQKALRNGEVRVDGATATASFMVKGGESVELDKPEVGAPMPAPDLNILYEDNDMLAVDKPAGLVVHLTESGRVQPTVAAFAAQHGVNDLDKDRPGIVHRLDKDTSGILLIAKDEAAKAYLQSQFRKRLVEKRYIALVRGRLNPDEATIRLPIDRDRSKPTKRAVVPGGREAVTHYRTMESLPGFTLAEVDLQTGRTHQIRVHLSHLGHPVAGDIQYGGPILAGLKRQFLHATSINLTAPSGKRVSIESPLPSDLKQPLDRLRGLV